MAKISQEGINLLKQFEGNRLKAYDDGTGTLTIGYGHTGPEVIPGLVWTQQQADEQLEKDLVYYSLAVEQLISHSATQGQFDSLVDFCYNEGINSLRNSTLLRLFNAGDILNAARQFGEWDIAGGAIQQGLVRRRVAELVRFLTA